MGALNPLKYDWVYGVSIQGYEECEGYIVDGYRPIGEHSSYKSTRDATSKSGFCAQLWQVPVAGELPAEESSSDGGFELFRQHASRTAAANGAPTGAALEYTIKPYE